MPAKSKKPVKEVHEPIENKPRKSRTNAVKKEIHFVDPLLEHSETEEMSIELEEFEFETDLESIEEYSTHAQSDEEPIMAESSHTPLDSDESEDKTFAKIEAPDYIHQPKKKLPPTFFEQLGRLPNLSSISLTDSIMLEIKREKRPKLGPEHIEEPSAAFAGVADDDEHIDEHEDEIDETSLETTAAIETRSSDEFSDFDFDFDVFEEKDKELRGAAAKRIEVPEEQLFDMFVKKQHTQVVFEERTNVYEERLEELKQIQDDIYEFMRDLIEDVIIHCEHRDTSAVIRERLDKVKLFKEFVNVFGELNIEAKVNEFVESKCISFYKRQKIYRHILPESTQEQFNTEYERYKRSLIELDKLLGRKYASKQIILKKQREAQELATSLEAQEKLEITQMENLIKGTFAPRASDNFNLFVNRRLEQLAKLREEISNDRKVLIRREHTMSLLGQKLENLENITDTLHLRDYEKMTNDVIGLHKYIDERNERCDRLLRSFHASTHLVAHIREKQGIMFHALCDQAKKLDLTEWKKKKLRTHVFELKEKRIHVQKLITEQSFKGGLIDKPALLNDFDTTVESVRELKEKVDDLKACLLKLESKISKLEENYVCK